MSLFRTVAAGAPSVLREAAAATPTVYRPRRFRTWDERPQSWDASPETWDEDTDHGRPRIFK